MLAVFEAHGPRRMHVMRITCMQGRHGDELEQAVRGAWKAHRVAESAACTAIVTFVRQANSPQILELGVCREAGKGGDGNYCHTAGAGCTAKAGARGVGLSQLQSMPGNRFSTTSMCDEGR